MEKRKVIIAPFNNKKAWEKADFICDGIDDQVEIQAAINLASSLKAVPKFRKGTYNISGSITLMKER